MTRCVGGLAWTAELNQSPDAIRNHVCTLNSVKQVNNDCDGDGEVFRFAHVNQRCVMMSIVVLRRKRRVACVRESFAFVQDTFFTLRNGEVQPYAIDAPPQNFPAASLHMSDFRLES
jgi:hypothetical protein